MIASTASAALVACSDIVLAAAFSVASPALSAAGTPRAPIRRHLSTRISPANTPDNHTTRYVFTDFKEGSIHSARCRHRAAFQQEQRLDEGQSLDLARVDALVGSMDQRLRLLDTEQHDLGVGERLLEDVAQRDRATGPVQRHLAAVHLLHRVGHRRERRCVDGAGERVPGEAALEVDADVPRRDRRQVSDQCILGVVRIHPGRHAQADEGTRLGLDHCRGSDDRRAVDAQHGDRRPGPDHVGDTVTEQVDAVEHVGILAELARADRWRLARPACCPAPGSSCCPARLASMPA